MMIDYRPYNDYNKLYKSLLYYVTFYKRSFVLKIKSKTPDFERGKTIILTTVIPPWRDLEDYNLSLTKRLGKRGCLKKVTLQLTIHQKGAKRVRRG